jgi:hypothetical protein
MKRALLPYYLSRALLSGLLGYAIAASVGVWWGIAMGLVVFAGFAGYAHSGWFLVDTRNALFPLRRDERGTAIRDRAMVLAVATGGLAYFFMSLLSRATPLEPQNGSIALALGVLAYFSASFWSFIRR